MAEMRTPEDILIPWKLHLEGDFDTQVENIFSKVRLTVDEIQSLRVLYQDLEFTLQRVCPGTVVVPFGSIVTGLGLKTSDVDCFIETPPSYVQSPNIVLHARNILKRFDKKYSDVYAISTATVPIVKFLHLPTKRNCDINFKSPNGVRNSELIRILLSSCHRALHLAILVKYWSRVHKITGTNLLSSYALCLMVIFYLQVKKILPSVQELQHNIPPDLVARWNTAFNKDIPKVTQCTESLYDLLGGFFKYYNDLKFKDYVISVYKGSLIERKLFMTADAIPQDYWRYKENLLMFQYKSLNLVTPMCIQDPFEHTRNPSAIVKYKVFDRIQAHFQFAAKQYDELPPDDFLKAILMKDPNKYKPPSRHKPRPLYKPVKRGRNNCPRTKRRGLQDKGTLRKLYEQITGANRSEAQ